MAVNRLKTTHSHSACNISVTTKVIATRFCHIYNFVGHTFKGIYTSIKSKIFMLTESLCHICDFKTNYLSDIERCVNNKTKIYVVLPLPAFSLVVLHLLRFHFRVYERQGLRNEDGVCRENAGQTPHLFGNYWSSSGFSYQMNVLYPRKFVIPPDIKSL